MNISHELRSELQSAGLTPGLCIRSAPIQLRSLASDGAEDTIRAVITTDAPAPVFDWERFDFVQEVLVTDGMELPPGRSTIPLLDNHNRDSVNAILGSVRHFAPVQLNDGLRGHEAELVLSQSDSAAVSALAKLREGHITDVSVGYEVKQYVYIPDGAKQMIQGREYTGPLKVSTQWQLKEVSLVPIGADVYAKIRSYIGGSVMKDKANDKTISQAVESQTVEPQPVAAAPQSARQDVDVLAQERGRITGILDACRVAGLSEQFARGLIDAGCSLDAARGAVFAEMEKRQTVIGQGAQASLDVVADQRDKFRSAALDGMLMRTGMRMEKPAPGARDFMGVSLLDMARQSLELAGVNTRGMSKRELSARALTPASTSDFPALMAAVVNKRLQAAYNEAPPTWQPFVSVTSAVDFKDIYGIKLSEAPNLMPLGENGEYQTATFADAQEKYRIATFGRVVPLTRQMIINDDLRAFTRIPQLFGNAARRMEADMVYSLLTSNPTMSDGNALFSTAHKNIEATTANKGVLSTDTLSSGRSIMRKQTGPNGALLDVRPAFLLVPVEWETNAEVILRSTALPDAGMSAAVHNPWANRLTAISDPRLSAGAWYFIADPGQIPTIEVAYLEGQTQPYVEEQLDFDSDALRIKVRHDFGCGVMDYVGMFRNSA